MTEPKHIQLTPCKGSDLDLYDLRIGDRSVGTVNLDSDMLSSDMIADIEAVASLAYCDGREQGRWSAASDMLSGKLTFKL